MSPGQVLHIYDDENVSLLDSESLPTIGADYSAEKVIFVALDFFFSSRLSARALAAYQFKLKHLTRLVFFVYRHVSMSLMTFMNMTRRAAMREGS